MLFAVVKMADSTLFSVTVAKAKLNIFLIIYNNYYSSKLKQQSTHQQMLVNCDNKYSQIYFNPIIVNPHNISVLFKFKGFLDTVSFPRLQFIH